MIEPTSTLPAALASIVGADHVRAATADDAIDGIRPSLAIEPESDAQIAAVLRHANDAGLAIAPRGGGTKLAWGNIPDRLDLIMSLRRLDRVIEHPWADMTVTAQAGCTVATLQQTVAQHGQRLSFDALWPDRATVGGILASNDAGALRLRYGALRDLVLGATIALPDGTIARSGGKVVKNVAGYDLQKLMTGALGTLGVITEATFRLHPLPPETRLISIGAASVRAANDLLLALLDSTLTPAAAQLYAAYDAAPRIDIRFEGRTSANDAAIEGLRRLRDHVGGLANESMPSAWLDRSTLWDDPATTLIVKPSVLPSQIGTVIDAVVRLSRTLRLRWRLVMQAVGVGVLRLDGANPEVLLATLTLLRAAIAELGGSCVVLACPDDIKERIDVWGATGDTLPVMRRIKQQFDPNEILNAGRFVRW